MTEWQRTPAGEALTRLMLDLFRLNSLILTAGDRLVADLGLTSARWQVLGAVAAAGQPQPVAWIARDLGGNRQNVQRIVNDLQRDGLVRFEANPHHRRAQLVLFTDHGRKTFDAAMALQAPWINCLTRGVAMDDLAVVQRVVTALRAELEPGSAADDPD